MASRSRKASSNRPSSSQKLFHSLYPSPPRGPTETLIGPAITGRHVLAMFKGEAIGDEEYPAALAASYHTNAHQGFSAPSPSRVSKRRDSDRTTDVGSYFSASLQTRNTTPASSAYNSPQEHGMSKLNGGAHSFHPYPLSPKSTQEEDETSPLPHPTPRRLSSGSSVHDMQDHQVMISDTEKMEDTNMDEIADQQVQEDERVERGEDMKSIIEYYMEELDVFGILPMTSLGNHSVGPFKHDMIVTAAKYKVELQALMNQLAFMESMIRKHGETTGTSQTDINTLAGLQIASYRLVWKNWIENRSDRMVQKLISYFQPVNKCPCNRVQPAPCSRDVSLDELKQISRDFHHAEEQKALLEKTYEKIIIDRNAASISTSHAPSQQAPAVDGMTKDTPSEKELSANPNSALALVPYASPISMNSLPQDTREPISTTPNKTPTPTPTATLPANPTYPQSTWIELGASTLNTHMEITTITHTTPIISPKPIRKPYLNVLTERMQQWDDEDTRSKIAPPSLSNVVPPPPPKVQRRRRWFEAANPDLIPTSTVKSFCLY